MKLQFRFDVRPGESPVEACRRLRDELANFYRAQASSTRARSKGRKGDRLTAETYDEVAAFISGLEVQ